MHIRHFCGYTAHVPLLYMQFIYTRNILLERGKIRRGVSFDDADDDDDDDDKDDGGESVWLFKHFHHKFAREGTPVSLAPSTLSPLSLS